MKFHGLNTKNIAFLKKKIIFVYQNPRSGSDPDSPKRLDPDPNTENPDQNCFFF